MLDLNKVMLIGNLTRDPEKSYLQSGTALAKMGLALNRRYKDKGGEWKEETTFVDVTAWGKTADFCGEYLKKGTPVFVEGRLKFESWERDGKRQSKLSVTAERIQFAAPKDRGGEGGADTYAAHQDDAPAAKEQDGPADDLPF